MKYKIGLIILLWVVVTVFLSIVYWRDVQRMTNILNMLKEFFSVWVPLTTVTIAFLGVVIAIDSLESQKDSSERAVRPVILFFNTGHESNGEDRWGIRNVGKEPALNVTVSYRMSESTDWIKDDTWPIGFPGIAFGDKCILFLHLKGPQSLIAEYEDIEGNLWTTTISGNRNSISNTPKEKRQLKQFSKNQWQLSPTDVPGTDCVGI
ncbi:MAG: hypothetical protein WB870_08175 [Gallionellaceae bacterium]